MVTIVTKTIGATGDYSTVAAWEAACPANLVTDDKIWRGECQNQTFNEVVVIGGQTTDATRYMELTTAAGASFADNANKLTNALRYNSANGASIEASVYAGLPFQNTTDFTRLSKLQIANTNTGGYGVVVMDGQGVIVDSVIAMSVGQFNSCFSGHGVYLAVAPIFKNCLAIIDTDYAVNGFNINGEYNYAYCYNCSAIRPSNRTVGGTGFFGSNTYDLVLKNCNAFGFTDFQVSPSTTGNNNASTTTISFGSSNQASLTYANQIQQPNSATGLDCRIKAGSSLIDNGADLSGSGVTTDIVGTARIVPYDIGVWEVSSAAPSWSSSAVWM